MTHPRDIQLENEGIEASIGLLVEERIITKEKQLGKIAEMRTKMGNIRTV